MTDKDESGLFDDSRRSFMKKGALATTALALGAGATAGTAAAQEGGTVLVYGDDYRPGVDFTVVSSLSTSTKEDLLEESGSEDDVFDDPDDWDVYVINYDLGTDAPTWGILFTEDVSLSAGDSDTMGMDGEFRDSEIDLVEATPGETDGNADDGEDDEEDDEMDDGNGNGDAAGNGDEDDGPGAGDDGDGNGAGDGAGGNGDDGGDGAGN